MPDFLLEIGCEEIPARMIDAASLELRTRLNDLLQRERLAATQAISYLDTPRRLAVLAPGIPTAQPDVTEQINGPSVSVAFKDGQPTPAAHAFAKKAGVEVSQLERVTTTKGEYLSAKVTKKGRAAADILAELLPKEINSIYWPKNMYWRKPTEKFVRPVRWLVAMLDDQIVPLEFDGIRAGNQSRGHRILADGPVQIARSGNAYVEALKQARVLGRADREAQIRKALDAATRTIPGARWREDKALLDKVVNLTEYPSVILGNFDPEFLELPEEVLVTVMRDHQNYFAIEDGATHKLAPHFLAVLNTDGDPHGIIRHGHERVLRARFNDARFFWQTDQKHPLRERTEWLKSVTFQKELGSYYEKALRVQRLCSWSAEIIRQGGMQVRPGVIHKAAYLAKTDLTTELVKEFTELQGIVGGLYARVQQLDDDLSDNARFAIADAIYDQYKPESMDDAVPRSVEGAVLSLSDKADSIAGMFALGLVPSGSKDPFALRRQANGIVRIIAEHKLDLCIGDVFRIAREEYKGTDAEKKFKSTKYTEDITNFFRERLEFYLRDARGFAYDVVNAVLAAGFDDINDVIARAEAVAQVRPSADFESISVAFKRMKNILRQANEKRLDDDTLTISLPDQEDAERELVTAITAMTPAVNQFTANKEYASALGEISKLRAPVDTFFDKVMVMVDDDELRLSRLALLDTLVSQLSTIADFSEIVTEGKK
jgi:glycyl-tRNA synthetase beta chain